ncbi:MAG: ester cyclase [Phycisphaerae bacterium]|jgi:predicted ester cyclase
MNTQQLRAIELPPPRSRNAALLTGIAISLASWGCAVPGKTGSPAAALSTTANKQLVRHYYEKVISTGDVEALPEFIDADYVEVHNGVRHKLGYEGAREHILGVRETYPDLRLTVERQIAEGEWVTSVVTARGTHRGVWMNMTPTNKPVQITAVNVDRVVDGRIVEHGGAANLLQPFMEIGAIRVAEPLQEEPQADSKVREWHRRYMEASNAHDLEKLRAMTSDEIVWRLGPWTLVGKEQALLPHENDLVMNTTLEVRNVRITGYTVEREVIERNDALRSVGMESWRHFSRVVFDNQGLVIRKEPWKRSPDDQEAGRRFRPFRQWVADNHPDAVPDFDGPPEQAWGREPAQRMCDLPEQWIAAGRPGLIDASGG